MINDGEITIAYLIAGVLFIRSLSGLSKQSTASAGNFFGMIGMALAVIVTTIVWLSGGRFAEASGGSASTAMGLLAGAIVIGAGIGGVLARRVEMTGMPELVAILHSFVGLAAVLVGIGSYVSGEAHVEGAALVVHLVEIWVGVAVGALTFTGSVIAWGKLRGSISGKPLLLPGRHALNALLVGSVMALAVPFSSAPEASANF